VEGRMLAMVQKELQVGSEQAGVSGIHRRMLNPLAWKSRVR